MHRFSNKRRRDAQQQPLQLGIEESRVQAEMEMLEESKLSIIFKPSSEIKSLMTTWIALKSLKHINIQKEMTVLNN